MKVNVERPTAERPTILVVFEYTISFEGDNIVVEVESEWENEEDLYIISINHPKGWIIDSTELENEQIEEITMEAKAVADAYDIFHASRIEEDDEIDDARRLNYRNR